MVRSIEIITKELIKSAKIPCTIAISNNEEIQTAKTEARTYETMSKRLNKTVLQPELFFLSKKASMIETRISGIKNTKLIINAIPKGYKGQP